ncbi:hypothetical protein BY458DRAFT_467483 [Sporodiniella umbellata]|nr:hypothetical protein BY458DRAFT_467483 [Sporodiniella umbellata]
MMNFNTFTIPVNQYTEDFGSEKLAIEQFGFPAENPDRLLFLVNAHAVGFSKETYRPLLVRLGERLRELKEYENTSISFLTMDSRYHGDSSILNKQRASKNYRWVDNAADIRQLVEYLKLKKKGTVIGIGHSWGASCIVLCEKVFSNTFDGLILMDVGMCIEPLPLVKRLKDTMYISFYRKDTWPDRYIDT